MKLIFFFERKPLFNWFPVFLTFQIDNGKRKKKIGASKQLKWEKSIRDHFYLSSQKGQGGWVRKSPKMCWSNTGMVPNLIIWWLIAKVLKNKLDVAAGFLLFVALGLASTSSQCPRPRKEFCFIDIITFFLKVQLFQLPNGIESPNNESESTNFLTNRYSLFMISFSTGKLQWCRRVGSEFLEFFNPISTRGEKLCPPH